VGRTQSGSARRDNAAFRVCSGGTVLTLFEGRWSNAVAAVLGARRYAIVALGQRKIRFSDADLARAWWACRKALGAVLR